MKKFLKVLLILFMSVFLTGILCICLIISVMIYGYRNFDAVKVQTVAENLTHTATSYELSPHVTEQLTASGNFAILLNGDGNVIWSLNKPDEIKESYSLSEVAAFSRWYLCGYPVSSWEYEDGLLVLGLPKHTMWKYALEFPESQVKTVFFIVFPIWLVSLLTIYLIQNVFNKAAREKNDAARTEWIAGVSHDIRTPLTMIMGYSDTLSREKLPEQTHLEVANIKRQSERMAVLMEDFNLFNRLQFGAKEVRMDMIKPAAVMRKAVVDILNTDLPDCYEIEMCLDEIESVSVRANAELLGRAITNLLRNSIIHNPNGCVIVVKGEKSSNRLYISIADNGKGYPDQVCRNGFKNSDYLNLHGFGLTIVHRIVEVHRGKLKFINAGGAVTVISLKI